MRTLTSALALSLLALLTTVPGASAAHADAYRSQERASSGDVLELRNRWRRDVEFTLSRADRCDPYEFRLSRHDRGKAGHSQLQVGPVAPGRSASVLVLPGKRISRSEQLGRVQVTVRSAGRHGRVLDQFFLPVDFRTGRSSREGNCGRDDRRDRCDRGVRCHDAGCSVHGARHEREDAAWDARHRGHAHGRDEACYLRDRPGSWQPVQAGQVFRRVIAAQHRN